MFLREDNNFQLNTTLDACMHTSSFSLHVVYRRMITILTIDYIMLVDYITTRYAVTFTCCLYLEDSEF